MLFLPTEAASVFPSSALPSNATHIPSVDLTRSKRCDNDGLVIHPLLITAAIGAMQQRNALHDVLTSIDQHIRYQQPQAQVGEPPTPLVYREMTGSSA